MDEFYEIKGYQYLSLNNNNMMGTIPPELFVGLPDLHAINFASNQLRGTIPSMIGTLSNLNCKSSELCIFYISDICCLTLIIVCKYLLFLGFIVHANSLSGTLPTEIGLLQNLTYILFSVNSFTGPIPPFPPAMQHLALDSNKFNSTIPTELGILTNITSLYLFENVSPNIDRDLAVVVNHIVK
jgi:hypothetical protein